jgi:hypothetical protein
VPSIRKVGRLLIEPLADQGGDEVAQAESPLDHLVMPHEAPGRREGLGDRRPGEREFHMGQRLGDLPHIVAQDHLAVVDPDLGEGRHPIGALIGALIGAWPQRARQHLDMARPVRAAVRSERNGNGRANERYVRDLDAADHEREEAQAYHQLLGRHRRLAGGAVAERDLVEHRGAARKQGYLDAAA